jgi:hypothetical protein
MTPMRNGGLTAAILSRVLTIRRYREGDLDACRALRPELEGDLARLGPDRLRVAEIDGRVVGVAGNGLLVVDAGCQSLGIGKALAEAAAAS